MASVVLAPADDEADREAAWAHGASARVLRDHAPDPDRRGTLRQVGVTALGSDSTTKLYAGFTSVPVERKWTAGAIQSLPTG